LKIPADPIIFFHVIDHATLFSAGGCRLPIQRAKLAFVELSGCHNIKLLNQNTKLPKFVHRKWACVVNIDVGSKQKNRQKPLKKYFKKIISALPTLFFSRYETGTISLGLRL
jgi:hypothetical protein